MNAGVLQEIDKRLHQIEAITDPTADVDSQFHSIIDYVATACGVDSPEYGLVLRARASLYRNRREFERAAEEYGRALPLIEKGGDAVLFHVVGTLTSLAWIFSQLNDHARVTGVAEEALRLISTYAMEPVRYKPPMEMTANADEVVAVERPFETPPEDIVANFAVELVRAVADGVPSRAAWIFDSLDTMLVQRPVVRLGVRLARCSLDPAVETFALAWALANPDGRLADFVTLAQWSQLGRVAIARGRFENALEVARRFQGLYGTSEISSSDLLFYRYEGISLEALVWSGRDNLEAYEQALRRLCEFSQSAFGVEAEKTIEAESQLGRLLVESGRSGLAVKLLRHTVQVRTRSPAHPDAQSAEALFDLGRCLDKNGEDTEAMAYYRAAYHIYRPLVNAGHHLGKRMLRAALGVAETARVAHDYYTAIWWFHCSLNDARDLGQSRTETIALGSNNLAEALLAQERLEEAAPLADEALAIRKELFGEDSPEYRRSLGVVMHIALRQRNHERISSIGRSSAKESQEWPAEVVIEFLEYLQDYEQAIHVCERALEQLTGIIEKNDASLLPRQEITLKFKLGELQALAGRPDLAIRCLREAFEAETLILSDECARRSLRQVRSLMAESRSRTELFLSLIAGHAGASGDDVHQAYQIVQQRRGMETRLLRLQKRSFAADAGPASISAGLGEPDRRQQTGAAMEETIKELRTARENLVQALVDEAQQPAPNPESPRIIAWQERVDLIEIQLASFVGQFSRDWEIIGLSSQIPSVAKGEAVVEYVLTQGPTPTYYVFVIRDDKSVHFRTIGEAAPLHRALAKFRTRIVNGQRTDAKFLSNRLLMPLLDLLEGVDHLYVVPDSELYTLSFDLLPIDECKLAIDRWTITYLWNGGERSGFNLNWGLPPKAAPAVVVYAPEFAAIRSQDGPVRDEHLEWRFGRLPFADQEGEVIAKKIGAKSLSGMTANVESVLKCGGAEIMHFATHSFYIARKPGMDSINQVDLQDPLLFRSRAVLREAMDRCGIALSGADAELMSPSGTPAGILFGATVIDMDLRGTDLVTLSSCQSGLGDVFTGEGIYGLRRAFRAAGARTVLSSLWKVPDEPTLECMTRFYDLLLSGKPRGEALREAKQALRLIYPDDLMFWGGFVLDGYAGALRRFSAMAKLKFGSFSAIELSWTSAMQKIEKGDLDGALESLEHILDSSFATVELRAKAAYQKAAIFRVTGRLKEAISTYDALIADPAAPRKLQQAAVVDRGLAKQLFGDFEGAYLDYTASLNSSDFPDINRAMVLVNRACALNSMGKLESAILDCDAVLRSANSPTDQRLKALLNRADFHRLQNHISEALADARKLTELPESENTSERAKAYLVLAMCNLEQDRLAEALENVRQHLGARVEACPVSAGELLASCTNLVGENKMKEASTLLLQLLEILNG